MAEKKTADQWFAEYGENHPHPASELIHRVCVPAVFFAVLGFVSALPVPEAWEVRAPWFNWALVPIVLAAWFYLRLSPALGAGLLAFMALCYWLLMMLQLFVPWPTAQICLVVFVLAEAGRLIGHRIEGKKPAFFPEIVSLLIGPARLMGRLYQRFGQRY